MSRRDNKILDSFETSLTKQSFKDDCDINNVVARFAQTGMLSHVNRRNPRYIDCVDCSDYQQALDLVHAAEAQFDALPAKIRAKFANDPSKLLAFLDDPKNEQEARDLGLIKVDPDAPKEAPKSPENPSTPTPPPTPAPTA